MSENEQSKHGSSRVITSVKRRLSSSKEVSRHKKQQHEEMDSED